MPRRIVVIDGHPDPDSRRFCHALADAYASGAQAGGHELRRIALAQTKVPLLQSAETWQKGKPAPPIAKAQKDMGWAEHLVIVYPLWLGSMPALLKAFFEQTFRPGFAVKADANSLRPGLLRGKSARIVVTMGMPAWLYRVFYRAHSLKSLERNVLRVSGIGPIRESLVGGVEAIGEVGRQRWLERMRTLGRQGR